MNFIINTDLAINKNLLRTDFIKNWDDIVVGGGHVIAAIKNNEQASLSGDIDIFFIGKKVTKEKIIQKVKNIYKWVTDFYEQKPTIKIYNETVTMLVRNYKIQVITQRTFSSVSELLNSFDLDCCRFAFDGKSIITVKAGENFIRTNKVSVCKNDFISDVSAPLNQYRSTKLMNRVKKYQERYQIDVEYTELPNLQIHQFVYNSATDSDVLKEYGYPGKEISFKKYIELLNSDKLFDKSD